MATAAAPADGAAPADPPGTAPAPQEARSSRWFQAAVLGAIALRLAWALGLGGHAAVAQRVEVATATSSILDVKEAVFLHDHGMDPYDGNAVHQAPLLITLLRPVAQLSTDVPLVVLFVLLDVAAALLLRKMAAAHQAQTPAQPPFVLSPDAVALLYLFNPYNVAACVGTSPTLLANLLCQFGLYYGQNGQSVLAAAMVASAAYLGVYPVLLLLPLAAFIAQQNPGTSAVRATLRVGAVAAAVLAALYYWSISAEGGTQFVTAVYHFALTAPDLAPNAGLSWYFFMELFKQFSTFFQAVFQLHVAIYAAPVAYRFWREPLFMAYVLTTVAALFKPYPTVADAGLALALMCLHSNLLHRFRYGFVAGSLLLFAAVLGPAFWHLWVIDGAGNANFFYAITLVHNAGHILLLTDAVYAMRTTSFVREHPEHAASLLTMR